jgi:hypothetical protein
MAIQSNIIPQMAHFCKPLFEGEGMNFLWKKEPFRLCTYLAYASMVYMNPFSFMLV